MDDETFKRITGDSVDSMVVLDKDFYDIDSDDLPDLVVQATVLGGQVYANNG